MELGTVGCMTTADTNATTSPVDVFKALADPTRLAVIERLGIGTASTSELAQPFDMALPSFTQHLDVLEQSGLIASYKQGRVRTYRLTPDPLERAGEWLGAQREHWTRRFDQLDAHLMTIPNLATPLPDTSEPEKEPT